MLCVVLSLSFDRAIPISNYLKLAVGEDGTLTESRKEEGRGKRKGEKILIILQNIIKAPRKILFILLILLIHSFDSIHSFTFNIDIHYTSVITRTSTLMLILILIPQPQPQQHGYERQQRPT